MNAQNGAKFFLGIVVLFLFSMYKSCQEMSYTFKGVTTEAKVTEMHETPGGRRSTPHLAVTYAFKVEGERRPALGRIDLPLGSTEFAVGDTVQVIYNPDDPINSTPVDRRSVFWPLLFLGFLAATVGFGFHLYRQAQADIAKQRSR